MKRIFVTLFALAFFSLTFAQNGNVKDVRQVYLWDVTLSMQGKAPGAPNIWEQVKGALIEDVQKISDERTEIVVIPFQHKALEEWREFATKEGKEKLISKIKEYKIPLHKFGDKMTTKTCLYEPLQYVVDRVLSKDKVDIVKLMTDGISDEHKAEYEELLSRWCQIAHEKDAYGFYIMLTTEAVAGRTVLEKIDPCRFQAIDLAELGGSNVSLLMLTPQQNIAFNVREDYGKKSLTIKYIPSGSGTMQPGYKIHVYSWENPYIKVDQVVEMREDNTVTVALEYRMSKDEMLERLPVQDNEKLYLLSEPARGMEEMPYTMMRILESPTSMEMINKPEKTVKFYVR